MIGLIGAIPDLQCQLSAAGGLLAFGFITPGFLLAGAALASIPIIIHILNRRRFKTIQWAAMDFLLQAMRKNRRRLRFEQWLLLAVRCGVLALLGLALARPLGCEDTSLASLAGRRTGLHVIIIDNSYSMSYEADRPDAKTHLDQAKLMARRLIDRLSPGGESVAVITASRPAAAVIARPAYDLDGARGAIDRITQTSSGTDLAGALQLALEIGREATAQPNRTLYIITDGTHSAWETQQADATRALGKELASVYKIVDFNLAKASQWNYAMIGLRPTENLVRAQFDNDFQALVRGFGTGPESLLQWKLDDQLLPGGGKIVPDLATPIQTQSQAQLRQGGLHVLSASLVGDSRLKLDDTRSRVVEVASELKILIVEGERGIGPLSGSGAFLQLALAPPSEEGENVGVGHARTNSYIRPELISDLELGNKVLGDYRAIILTAVPQVSAQEADQLRAFVQQGGTLILFMGEPVNSDAYNQTLLPRGLLPGPLARRRSVSGDQKPFLFDFKPNGALHPLLQKFQALENTGLDTAAVFTYWQVEMPADAKAQRVLNYLPDDKGVSDPAITVQDLGEGHVVFVSTTANWEWTYLPVKPAYVALMHELVAGNVTSGDRWLNLTVGDRLEVPMSVQLSGAPTLKDAQQVDIMLQQSPAESRGSSYRSEPLLHPGIYTLSAGNRRYRVAVNVPDDEADIRPVDDTAIRKALGDVELTLLADQLPAQTDAQIAGNDFGWSFMTIVLALVGLECFLAMRFGHHKR